MRGTHVAPPPTVQWAGASLPPPLSFVFLQDSGFYFPLWRPEGQDRGAGSLALTRDLGGRGRRQRGRELPGPLLAHPPCSSELGLPVQIPPPAVWCHQPCLSFLICKGVWNGRTLPGHGNTREVLSTKPGAKQVGCLPVTVVSLPRKAGQHWEG